MRHLGSCLCGRITFEVVGSFDDFCHCRSCRKDTGSAHTSNLFSATVKLRWLKGKEEVKSFN